MEPSILENIVDGKEKPTHLSFALLENITENFSEDRIIGEGGFAMIYKGVLPNGNVVAMKRIKKSHVIDEKLFYREVDCMLTINHQNVVQFLGFCAITEQKVIQMERFNYVYTERIERLLCSEYMRNGSLQKYISDELRELEWNTCYGIIKGICEGLYHLHKEKHVFHMDLKPDNILLDNHMVPKIMYYALSRLEELKERSQTTSGGHFGSLRYYAPEYCRSGMMSFKSDIFSLGIIITELVTGDMGIPNNNKKNVHERWRHKWKRSAKETPLVYQQVTKCMKIGLLCQDIDPSKRPFIWDLIHDIREMDSDDGTSMPVQISPYPDVPIPDIDPLELEPENLDVHKIDISCPFEPDNKIPVVLTLEHLKAITKDYSTKLELGRGGYGVVYKGVYPSGEIVAVKKLFAIHIVQDDQFRDEVSHLTGIKHRNVVQTLGYCAETSWEMIPQSKGGPIWAETPKRLICFEYVPNKSLDKYISDESVGLDWNLRYKIIEEICKGLHFLHEECHIVHLDLKPENILMDAAMVPKIADFGLSKIFGDQQTRSIISDKCRAGSAGYMAPEYILHGKVSPRADIFSLGVIILQIVTGHREYPLSSAYFKLFNKDHCPQIIETSFQDYTERVVESWRKKFTSAPQYEAMEKNTMEKYTKQVKKCIEIGLNCVDIDVAKRPTAKDVIQVLNGVDQAQGSHEQDKEDVYFDDESAEAAISSLRLGDDQDSSLFTNSNWSMFDEERHQ